MAGRGGGDPPIIDWVEDDDALDPDEVQAYTPAAAAQGRGARPVDAHGAPLPHVPALGAARHVEAALQQAAYIEQLTQQYRRRLTTTTHAPAHVISHVVYVPVPTYVPVVQTVERVVVHEPSLPASRAAAAAVGDAEPAAASQRSARRGSLTGGMSPSLAAGFIPRHQRDETKQTILAAMRNVRVPTPPPPGSVPALMSSARRLSLTGAATAAAAAAASASGDASSGDGVPVSSRYSSGGSTPGMHSGSRSPSLLSGGGSILLPPPHITARVVSASPVGSSGGHAPSPHLGGFAGGPRGVGGPAFVLQSHHQQAYEAAQAPLASGPSPLMWHAAGSPPLGGHVGVSASAVHAASAAASAAFASAAASAAAFQHQAQYGALMGGHGGGGVIVGDAFVQPYPSVVVHPAGHLGDWRPAAPSGMGVTGSPSATALSAAASTPNFADPGSARHAEADASVQDITRDAFIGVAEPTAADPARATPPRQHGGAGAAAGQHRAAGSGPGRPATVGHLRQHSYFTTSSTTGSGGGPTQHRAPVRPAHGPSMGAGRGRPATAGGPRPAGTSSRPGPALARSGAGPAQPAAAAATHSQAVSSAPAPASRSTSPIHRGSAGSDSRPSSSHSPTRHQQSQVAPTAASTTTLPPAPSAASATPTVATPFASSSTSATDRRVAAIDSTGARGLSMPVPAPSTKPVLPLPTGRLQAPASVDSDSGIDSVNDSSSIAAGGAAASGAAAAAGDRSARSSRRSISARASLANVLASHAQGAGSASSISPSPASFARAHASTPSSGSAGGGGPSPSPMLLGAPSSSPPVEDSLHKVVSSLAGAMPAKLAGILGGAGKLQALLGDADALADPDADMATGSASARPSSALRSARPSTGRLSRGGGGGGGGASAGQSDASASGTPGFTVAAPTVPAAAIAAALPAAAAGAGSTPASAAIATATPSSQAASLAAASAALGDAGAAPAATHRARHQRLSSADILFSGEEVGEESISSIQTEDMA